jgi:hypothetical protein
LRLSKVNIHLQFYERHIVEEMLTGRQSEDYGLNIQTGTDARSWSIKTIADGYLLWTSAKYLIYNQLGGEKIPKRLYVYEEFKTIGRENILRELKKDIRKAVR